ncbi:P-loop containing nucleoside triphosphate hydrolase protein [Mycena rosella]|uniref:P-loop containing nucleoside triphosphate hydrolase protein n=1 Tax=Mycena rosella TaxID=1033263 RepID=A0AAD7DFM8_MYCRO|nr:P-loop containing nucleoside triphosphate hydrolase protein [Mycena rosella]
MPSPGLLYRLQARLGVNSSHHTIRGCLAPTRTAKLSGNSRRNYSTPVLTIPKANVYRFGDANRATPVFHDVEWTIHPHESWAVVGTGSGEKSALFDRQSDGAHRQMLTGHLRIHPPPPPPAGLFPFLADSKTQNARDPHDCVALVSFANRRAAGGAFYDYTARYGAVREEDRVTLRQSMFPETIDDLKAQTRMALAAPATDRVLFAYLVDKMGLAHLLDLPRIALSNGQTRRARILKALLAKPHLLLLDEPLTGLDVESRATVLAILHELHVTSDPHIVLGIRMQDAVPAWITHLAVVHDGTVRTGPKAAMLAYKAQLSAAAAPADDTPPAQHAPLGAPVVEMHNVIVAYGPRTVLKDVTWTIRAGGRYHLQGANGSGKTTLLALLTGDHPQSYTQRGARQLRLFGAPRHETATRTLHARIGVVTPELADAFPRRAPGMSVWEAVGTGFEGGFVPLGPAGVGLDIGEAERARRVARVREVLRALGPLAWGAPAPSSSENENKNENWDTETARFAALRFPELPAGEQRLVLLMRALVAQPPLVLLDEVWSGMDGRMVRAARAYLRGGGIGEGQAVVVVTHLEEEVPWGVGEGVVRVLLRGGELREG